MKVGVPLPDEGRSRSSALVRQVRLLPRAGMFAPSSISINLMMRSSFEATPMLLSALAPNQCSLMNGKRFLLSGHRVIAIEIKASASPGRDSGRHLAWLRDELGDRFIHGLVLHAGRHIYSLDDRVTAAPICTIWS